MPVHDWTRVSDGIFHHFHHSWVVEIKRALRRGLQPMGYYIMVELMGGEQDVRGQQILVIRQTNDHRIVAMVVVLGPWKKSNRHAMRSFMCQTIAALDSGVHILLVDVHPPSPEDPLGFLGTLLIETGARAYLRDTKRPLAVASLIGGTVTVEAFLDEFAVGQSFPEMPLFTGVNYVPVPLEATYMAAWEDVPPQYQEILRGPV